MSINEAFPVNWHYADMWKTKTLAELELIRDKIYEKMNMVDRQAAGNVNDEYQDMLEQLDYLMAIKSKEEDERQAQVDDSRRSER